MQNSLNKESTVVEFTSKSAADAKKGMTAPSELVSQSPKIGMQETQKPAQITPLKARVISVIKKDGTLMGTAAAIDKDLTAAVLAKEVNADVLMYLTDVDNIVLNYGSDSEIPLYELSAKEAEDHIKAGSFAAGTMDPKVRGGIDFVQTGTNRRVIITTLEKARAALDGKAGTVIY